MFIEQLRNYIAVEKKISDNFRDILLAIRAETNPIMKAYGPDDLVRDGKRESAKKVCRITEVYLIQWGALRGFDSAFASTVRLFKGKHKKTNWTRFLGSISRTVLNFSPPFKSHVQTCNWEALNSVFLKQPALKAIARGDFTMHIFA